MPPESAQALRRVNVPGILAMLILLGLWESAVRSGLIEFQFLPAPSAVAQGLGRLLTSGELLGNLLHTLKVTLLGWVTAGLLGVGLGLVLGLSDTAWRYSMASIEVMRAIPPVSLVPVALLVFGFSVRMELTIIVFVTAWPVLVNAIDGVRSVRGELLDVTRMLRLSKVAAIRKVILPAAAPSIVVGLRLAMSLSLVLAVVAEMIGNPSGLGNALILAQQALRPEEMFAYVLTIGLLGVALNTAFRIVATKALPSLAGDPGNAT